MDVSKFVERGAIAANGVWAEIGVDARVFIVSSSSIDFIKKREGLERRWRKANGRNANYELRIEEAFKLTKEAASEAIIRNWEGFKFNAETFARVCAEQKLDMAPPPNPPPNGSDELPFSPANALWMFDADPTFWKAVSDLSGDPATFDRDNLEEMGKASGR